MQDTQTDKGCILIVDDNPTNIQVLLDALQGHGYERLVALDGEMALEQAIYAQPDLILLDVMMPGIDGFETCRRLKAEPQTSQIPVIFMTALSEVQEKIQGFEAGAVDYVTKPLQHQEVLARIATHITLRRLQTELQQKNNSLEKSEQRYALALQGSRDGIWDWDLVQGEIYFSPRWLQMLGFSEGELPGKPQSWFDLVHPDDLETLNRALQQHIQGESEFCDIEYRLRHKCGDYRWMLCRGVALRDKRHQAFRLSGSQSDITDGKVADSLTGLPNGILFSERLDRILSQGKDQTSHFSVLILEIDRFKILNDSLGQKLGDQLLAAVAGRLLSSLTHNNQLCPYQGSSLVAHMGSGMFAILLENTAQQKVIQTLVEHIREQMIEVFRLDKMLVCRNLMIGSALSTGVNSASEIITHAKTAMHHARLTSTNGYAPYDENMQAQVLAKVALESELWQAIKDQNFELFYQPILSLTSGEIIACEALIRWQHSTRGTVSPLEFIPLAEEIGAIVPLGEWVIKTACAQQSDWQKMGFGHIQVAINVSAVQFQQSDIPQIIFQALAETGASAQKIKVEITESVSLQDVDFTINTLQKLRAQGIEISMDDFGTGYSSLSYLARLPINYLKVDQAFVAQINQQDNSRELVSPILAMAKCLQLKVIAEGVETQEQLTFLREHLCDEMQGYFFSPPVPVAQFTELLNSHKHLSID